LEKFLPRQGRYRQVQYQLQWRNYPSGGPIVADLHNHSLDFGILGDYPLLVSALANPAQGQAHTHLIGFTAANADGSGNAIIVPQRSQIRDIQDLRGHTLALPLGSAAHGMVLRSLAAAQLLEDVELVFLKPDLLNLYPPERADADSYAHFAPFPELACRQGQYRYLAQANSAQLPAFYGIVAAAEFAQHHPDIVVAYLQALQAAQAWYTSTADATTLVGQWLGYDPELVAQILNPNPVYRPQEGGSGIEQRHFFPTLDLRPDWIAQHIDQLGQVRGNEAIRGIDLDRWIRPEFLQQVAG
jgi:NitT/TauT family transport system substrate-binding protein